MINMNIRREKTETQKEEHPRKEVVSEGNHLAISQGMLAASRKMQEVLPYRLQISYTQVLEGWLDLPDRKENCCDHDRPVDKQRYYFNERDEQKKKKGQKMIYKLC